MRATLGRLLLRDESSSRSLRMQWAPVTCKSTLPLARYGHTMTLGEDGKIYVLCGHLDNVGGAFLKEFFVCDPATLMWERLPDTPFCSRNLHCCVAYGGALWVSFGRGNGYLGDLHCFVLATKEWKVIEAKGKRLLRRYGSTAVVWNGNMWVFGGYDENGFSSNDLNCFSFDTLTWSSVEQLGAIPEARHNHMSDIVIVNENPYLLIFGGRGAYSPLADANLFSFQSHLWTSVPPSSSPSPRFACSGAFVPAYNCALIYGGTDGKTDFSDAYILDLGSLHWHKGRKGDSPPVSFHSSVVVGNEVWFYGGKGVAPAILSCKIIDATNSSPLPGKHSPSSRIRHIRASIHHSCSGTSGVSGSAASSSSSTTTSDARSVTSHQTEGTHTPYDIEYTPTKPPSVSTPRVEIITTSTVSAAPASPTVTEDANNSDIKKWLCTLGLETYAEVFIAEEISLSTLPSLTEDDLKELGLKMGARKRVLAEAKLLKSTPPVILSTTTESEMHLKDVVPTAILGQGAHGAVYSGVWQGTTPVALKMIKSNTEREFMQEFSVLKGLRHPNLIQFLGVFTPDTPLIFGSDVLSSPFIVTELAQLGSLDHYLETTSLTMSTILEFGKMIAAGMNYLSQRQIVHRDLALRNCLVGTGPVVKVADFGLSRFTESAVYTSQSHHFPIRWTAPEAVEFNKFTTQSDCWSYGVTLWEICEKGKVPYSSMSNQEVLHAVKAGMTLEFPDGLKSYCNCGCSTPATASTTTTTTDPYADNTPPSCVAHTLYSIMLQCWSSNPAQRPSFEAIFKKLCELEAQTRLSPPSPPPLTPPLPPAPTNSPPITSTTAAATSIHTSTTSFSNTSNTDDASYDHYEASFNRTHQSELSAGTKD